MLSFKLIAVGVALGVPVISYVRNEYKGTDHLKFYRNKNTKQITLASMRVPSEFDDYEEWKRTPNCKLSNEEFIKFVEYEYRHPWLANMMRTLKSGTCYPKYSLEYYIHISRYHDKLRELEPVN